MALSRRRPKQAMTLVELLVVMAVILLLVAVSIPAVRPAIEDGYLREASRQLNVFIAAAQARATQLNREVGIRLTRTSPGAESCVEVFIVEAPLPFAGDFVYARATLRDTFPPLNGGVDSAVFEDGRSSLVTTLVRPGDTIRFDYKGAVYRISTVDTFAGSPRVQLAVQTGTNSPLLPAVGLSLPYQIFRQHVASGVRPLQLPAGTCVDLQYSGHSVSGTQFQAKNDLSQNPIVLDSRPVDIIFRPRGGISRLTHGRLVGATVVSDEFIPAGSVYLLVGRLAQSQPAPGVGAAIEKTNLADPAVTWLAISDLDGRLTVAENDAFGSDLAAARLLVRSAQTIGGR